MLNDLGGRLIGVGQERSCRGGGKGAARADADDAVARFDDVACAGDQQRDLRVGDDDERLEPTQRAVGPPLLREFDRSLLHVRGRVL